jgi:hypothetical protein
VTLPRARDGTEPGDIRTTEIQFPRAAPACPAPWQKPPATQTTQLNRRRVTFMVAARSPGKVSCSARPCSRFGFVTRGHRPYPYVAPRPGSSLTSSPLTYVLRVGRKPGRQRCRLARPRSAGLIVLWCDEWRATDSISRTKEPKSSPTYARVRQRVAVQVYSNARTEVTMCSTRLLPIRQGLDRLKPSRELVPKCSLNMQAHARTPEITSEIWRNGPGPIFENRSIRLNSILPCT